MSNISVSPISGALGAVISGVDLSQPLSHGDPAAVRQVARTRLLLQDQDNA